MRNAEELKLMANFSDVDLGHLYYVSSLISRLERAFYGNSADFVEPCPDIDIVAKIVEDAYQKGAEDMRIAAAKVAESYLMIGYKMNPQFPQIAKNTAEQIRSLPLHPEGGGR